MYAPTLFHLTPLYRNDFTGGYARETKSREYRFEARAKGDACFGISRSEGRALVAGISSPYHDRTHHAPRVSQDEIPTRQATLPRFHRLVPVSQTHIGTAKYQKTRHQKTAFFPLLSLPQETLFAPAGRRIAGEQTVTGFSDTSEILKFDP